MATYQKRGDKWRAIVRKKGFPPQSKTFSTKARAQRWAREIEGQLEDGSFSDEKVLARHKLGDIILRYRKRIPDIGRTKDACLRTLDRHLGDVPLSALTKQRIAEFGRERAAEGAGPSTLAQDIIYLAGVLDTARAHWDVPVPASLVPDARAILRDEKLIGHSKERDRRPTDDELGMLKEYWQRPMVRRQLTCPMADIVDFAIVTAMRLSEITRIRWEDIDEEARTVLIRDRKHPSKKDGNHQEVPLLGAAWDIVQRQQQDDDEPRIFPFKPESLSANFTRAVLRCGIRDLHFHDLRHHGISLLFEAGYSVPEVALVSGHRDWKQLRRYTQLQARDLHREGARA